MKRFEAIRALLLRRRPKLYKYLLLVFGAGFLLLVIIPIVHLARFSELKFPYSLNPLRKPSEETPSEFRVIGLVFFGRRDRVSILDCYLKVRAIFPPDQFLNAADTCVPFARKI